MREQVDKYGASIKKRETSKMSAYSELEILLFAGETGQFYKCLLERGSLSKKSKESLFMVVNVPKKGSECYYA